MDSRAPAEGWSMIPTHGDSDECERIIHSISEIASCMESGIQELAKCNAAAFDHRRALQVLGRLDPLQRRLQRMHSSLLEFGSRVPISSHTSNRGVADRLQYQSTSAHVDALVADGQMFEEQPPILFRRVAILTFSRWSGSSIAALQQAGFIKGRGQHGCVYTACLTSSQRQYLEQSRRLCVYHVVAEESRISDIVAVVARLPYLQRSKLTNQEVVDLPAINDGRAHGQQAASSSSAPPASCFSTDRPNCSASRSAPGSSAASTVNVPGSVLQSGESHCGEAQRHQGSVRVRWPNAFTGQHPQVGQAGIENRDSAERDDVAWTVLGFDSF